MKKINKFTAGVIIFFLVVGINIINTEKVNAAEKGKIEIVKNGFAQSAKAGWMNKDGKRYYMQANGELAKYWTEIDGKMYYFTGSNELVTGWLTKIATQEKYYFNKDGVMQTGFIKVDGNTYYMNKDGAMVKYWNDINGKTYYFNSNGEMITGWLREISNNKWHYFDENGVLQPSKAGWMNKDGKRYYVQANGDLAKYWTEIDGKTYYFTGDNELITGWLREISNNKWHYFDENGVLQPSKTGWINKYGKTYYMQSNGELAKYLNNIDDKTYYFNGSGEMLTGWIQFSSNNRWRYFNKDGVMAKYWNNIDGKRYYFNGSGEMLTGWLDGSDGWYYLDPKDGHMMTNTTIDGYYISENGKREGREDKGNKVVDYAKKFLGTKYVYGGTTPSGFDCSGFTQYVYKHALGIDISRTTYTQINHGKAVSRSDLKVGDLVFPSAGHVGIYIGNGKIIHAPHTGDVVKISNIWSFYAARRIIN